MKTLADNKVVPDRCYYYLLDWNDKDEKVRINKLFKKESISSLTFQEFWDLFIFACTCDMDYISVDSPPKY